MNEWWNSLDGLNQFFFGMAAFFSVFFIWQVIAAFMGLTGDDMDVGGDADVGDLEAPDEVSHSDVIESAQAFKILSIRSLVTFFTLFSWGSALYLSTGMEPAKALGISSVWGLVGMFSVALVFYGMAKLAEVGTKDVKSCKGQLGTVYLDIPEGGYGEIRVLEIPHDIKPHPPANSLCHG